MTFSERPPSPSWELLTLPGLPKGNVWVWFKPAQAPDTLILRVPPETLAACGPFLTLRALLVSAGVDPTQVESWNLQGIAYPAEFGQSPLLDLPIPPPLPWGELTIIIKVVSIGRGYSLPAPVPGVLLPVSADAERLMDAFEADWQALIQIERQLEAVRKQLGAMQGRLQSLNRDLNPDERRAADNQDNRDWQEARRWLRDAAAQVSRYIRDHDMGLVSAAGHRTRYETIYKDHIVPRRPCEGLAAIQQEFEQHRKTAQSLLIQMQSAHINASRDGVQRAQQILGRIAAKVRGARAKR